jgi:HEAT repeat protein
LRGGDLRSIGRSNEVAEDIEKNVSLFEIVFSGLYDTDPVVRMRSAGVIEKATQIKPELLSGHKSEIISILTTIKQQEVCWHMVQIVPPFQFTANEENEIIKALKRFLKHESKIVRVSAMESLAIIAERNRSILKEVVEITKEQKKGNPALQARGRKLLKRLERKKTDV